MLVHQMRWAAMPVDIPGTYGALLLGAFGGLRCVSTTFLFSCLLSLRTLTHAWQLVGSALSTGRHLSQDVSR
jgi:hypothetical protein